MLIIFVIASGLVVATFVAWSFAISSSRRAIAQIDPGYASRLFRSAEDQYLWRQLPMRTSVLFDGAPSPELARWINPLRRLTRAVEVLLALAIVFGALLLVTGSQ